LNKTSLELIESIAVNISCYLMLPEHHKNKLLPLMAPAVKSSIAIIIAISDGAGTYKAIAEETGINLNSVRNICKSLERGGFPIAIEIREAFPRNEARIYIKD
jgi:hypothetical protein